MTWGPDKTIPIIQILPEYVNIPTPPGATPAPAQSSGKTMVLVVIVVVIVFLLMK